MADVILFQRIYYPLRIESFHNNKRNFLLHTIKKIISVTLFVYACFKSFWRISISGCVIHSLLRSRSGRSHATLPAPTDGERCVTPARAAAKETTWFTAILSTAEWNSQRLDYTLCMRSVGLAEKVMSLTFRGNVNSLLHVPRCVCGEKKGFWRAQCTFQSSAWWFIDYCRHHITWSKS